MPIVWTESQTLKLVTLYSRHECLRNPFHRSFKDKLCRYKAYREITDSMNICGLTVCDCIKRITHIKTQYCYELSKISAAISCEKFYKPKAVWFPIMHQLLFPYVESYGYTDVFRQMRGDETGVFQGCCARKPNDRLIRSDPVELKKPRNRDCSCSYKNCRCGESAAYKTKPHTASKKDWTQESLVTKSLHHRAQCATGIDVGSNTGRCVIRDHETQTVCISVKDQSATVKSESRDVACPNDVLTEEYRRGKNKEQDEFDMFGKSIAFQLRNINFENAIKLEKRIQSLIVQERLDGIRSKCVSHAVQSDCTSSCSDCKMIARDQMICSCGLPVIMINADPSCEFDCK